MVVGGEFGCAQLTGGDLSAMAGQGSAGRLPGGARGARTPRVPDPSRCGLSAAGNACTPGRSLSTRLGAKTWDKLRISKGNLPSWYFVACAVLPGEMPDNGEKKRRTAVTKLSSLC